MRKRRGVSHTIIFLCCLLAVPTVAMAMGVYPMDAGLDVLKPALLVGALLGLAHLVLRPVLRLLFAPIGCLTLGLFGAVSLILVFLFLIYRFVIIAVSAPDRYGAFLVIGVMAHIAIQVILNIAVVTNLIPNTGITLPFISYGGSAVVMQMAEIGVVMNVARRIKA